MTVLYTDKETNINHALNAILLDTSLQLLIKNGDLKVEKLNAAIAEALNINQDKGNNTSQLSLMMSAYFLQCRYRELT